MTRIASGRERAPFLQRDTIARFGELALRSDDLDEILHEACRLIGEALGTDVVKVMELQEDGITLLVRAGVGRKPGVVGEVTRVHFANVGKGSASRYDGWLGAGAAGTRPINQERS